jgi:small GTP-binding protein
MAASDEVLKVIIIGDSTVGKTQLTLRFADDTFSDAPMPTIGVDFRVKEVSALGSTYRLQIWDTAGQERFRNITESYYRRARGVIIVYDLSNRDSFHQVEAWIGSIARSPSSDIPRVLVGNKDDLPHAVSDAEIAAATSQYKIQHFLTSAKTGKGVNEVFVALTELIVIATRKVEGPGVPIAAKVNTKKRKKC